MSNLFGGLFTATMKKKEDKADKKKFEEKEKVRAAKAEERKKKKEAEEAENKKRKAEEAEEDSLDEEPPKKKQKTGEATAAAVSAGSKKKAPKSKKKALDDSSSDSDGSFSGGKRAEDDDDASVLEFLDSDDNLSETDLEELREIIATGMIPEEEQIKKQEKEAETVYPVFVVGLEPTLDKKDLVNHFSSVANPVQARVLMQKRGGVSTAVAFVDFGTKSEADRIIKKFNNTKFQNKSITVRHADNSKKGKEEVVTQSVYVRNLPFSVKEVKLEKLFEKFGDVKGIRLPVFEDTQKHKGYAFIDFSDAKSAKKALALDRTEVDGRKILVELAKKEHQEQERSEEPKQKKPFPNKRSFKH